MLIGATGLRLTSKRQSQSVPKVDRDRRVRALCAAVAAGAMSFWSGSAHAANTNGTWLNTGSTSANWNDATNWVSGAVPGSTATITGTNADSSIALFNTPVVTYGTSVNPIVIDSTSENIAGINFDTAAGSFVIGSTAGNPLYLSSGGTIQTLSTLLASSAETINAPLVIEGANGSYSLLNNGVGTGTLTFGGQISGGNAGATLLTIGGTNGSGNAVSGSIVNGSATTLAVTKAGAGLWVLNGANTYTGPTLLQAGTLRLTNTGALTGSALTISSGSTLDLRSNSNVTFATGGFATAAAGTVNFNVDNLNGSTTGQTLTLGGGFSVNAATTSEVINVTSGTGDGYALALGNVTAAASTGAVTLNAVGANASITTFTGEINNNNANGGGFGVGDTDLILAGTGNFAFDNIQRGNSSRTVGITENTTGTVTIDPAGNTVSTIGVGSTRQAYTTLNNGTLVLNFANLATPTNLLAGQGTTNMPLILGGGAISILGKASGSTSQVFTSNTLNAGASNISLTNNGTAVLLTLNAITRNVGSTLNIGQPSGAISATNGVTTTTADANFTGGQQTILGGYATVGGSTWAVSGTTGTNVITGLASYTNTSTAALSTDGTKDVDVAAAGTNTTTSALTINSLRFNDSTGPSTVNVSGGGLTIATGGLLETASVGANSVTISNGSGGSLTSGNGTDLIVNQYNPNATLTISSLIAGNIGLTKTGPGTVALASGNTFTGSSFLNGGTTTIAADSSLGDSGAVASVTSSSTASKTVTLASVPVGFAVGTDFLGQQVAGISGTTVTLSANANTTVSSATNVSYVNPLSLDNASLVLASGVSLSESTGGAANRYISLNANNSVDFQNNVTETVAGIISGIGGLTALSTGTSGILSLSGANTFSGGLTATGNGQVRVDGNPNSALGTGTITLNNTAFGSNGNIYWHNQNPSAVTNNFNIIGSNNEIDISQGANETYTYSGNFTGAGSLTWTFGFSNIGSKFTGDWTGYTGTVQLANSAYLQFANNTMVGLPSGTLSLTGGSVQWNGTGSANIPLGALTSAVTTDSLANDTAGTATWQVGGLNTNTTFAGNISDSAGTAALQKNGSGALTLSGLSSYSGGTTINNGTIILGSSPIAAASATGTATAATTSLTVSSTTGTITVGQAVTGPGIANGTVVSAISGSTVTLNVGTSAAVSGTFNFLAGGPIGSPTNALTVNSGGTLDMNSVSTTVGSLSGSGVITSGTNTGTPVLTVNNTGSSTTFTGVVQNGLSTTNGVGLTLASTNSSTLTLTGHNTYSGITSINGGTLALNDSSSATVLAGSSQLNVATTGTLALTSVAVAPSLVNSNTPWSINDAGVSGSPLIYLNFSNSSGTGSGNGGVPVENVFSLSIDGVGQVPGLYGVGATNPNNDFGGTGEIDVLNSTPEPGSLGVLTVCGLGLMRRQRRARLAVPKRM